MYKIDEYLERALQKEIEFLKSRDVGEIQSFRKENGVVVVPGEIMFPEGEDIVVKAPISSYLAEKYCLDDPTDNGKKMGPFFHKHDFFEFNYVASGELENLVDGKKIIQGEGCLVLMNPDAAHHVQSREPQTIYYNILVKKCWAEEVFAGMMAFHRGFFNFFLDSVYGLNRRHSYLIFEVTEELKKLLEGLIVEYYSENIYRRQMMFAKLYELFVLLSRQSETYKEKIQKNLRKDNIEEILSYMTLHYADITLETAAEKLGYAPGYLTKLLKKETGRTFSEHILDFKIRSACNYLKNSELSIERIAEAVGYYDASHFNKVFRKTMGMAPGEYRKKKD